MYLQIGFVRYSLSQSLLKWWPSGKPDPKSIQIALLLLNKPLIMPRNTRQQQGIVLQSLLLNYFIIVARIVTQLKTQPCHGRLTSLHPLTPALFGSIGATRHNHCSMSPCQHSSWLHNIAANSKMMPARHSKVP